MPWIRRFTAALFVAILACAPLPAAAQEATEVTNVAELTFVWTAGNATSSTFGAKYKLGVTGERNVFTFDAGGIRTTSTTSTRLATGSADGFTLAETETSVVTAESYFAKGRYDRRVSERFSWFVGSGWTRNTFSGIASRVSSVLGASRTWKDDESVGFATDLGVTYNIEDPVANESETDRFFGLRLSSEARWQATPSAELTNTLVLDESLQESSDFRIDATQALSVAMNESLALKASLQVLYDVDPANVSVTLVDGTGTEIGQVPVPLDKVDSIFTIALVVNF